MERCPHTRVTGNGAAEYEEGRVKVKYDTGCLSAQHLHLVLPQSGFLGEIGYWSPCWDAAVRCYRHLLPVLLTNCKFPRCPGRDGNGPCDLILQRYRDEFYLASIFSIPWSQLPNVRLIICPKEVSTKFCEIYQYLENVRQLTPCFSLLKAQFQVDPLKCVSF